MSAYGLNLPQDPLESNVEEVINKGEEKVEEYDSDSDSSLSLPHLSEDDDEESDALVPPILTTRNGRQIWAVQNIDFKALTKCDHPSPIADHIKTTGNNIKWDHFEILASGKTDLHCKIKETLHIQELQPSFMPMSVVTLLTEM
ncbi:hypothetical protein ACROYT_G009610 [Oculina patagonica]